MPELNINIPQRLEELVWELDISYMDAAIQVAEELDVEIEVVAARIKQHQALVSELRKEAEALNFIEREHRLDL